MGRKLDALLGRNFRASKFRPLLTLALSRLSILSNKRRVTCSQARSDVLQLLQLPHHHRALLRVEKVIKEHNALDAYVLIEGYLNLLLERTTLLEQHSECPEELKEAVAGLLFAASRCGDFPELHEIKSVLTTRYGKEFAARAVELRNNCGVNLTLMQKLSTRQPTLESRMEVLEAIASENGIVLQIPQPPPSNEDEVGRNARQKQAEPQSEVVENLQFSTEVASGSKQKYKDVADAAQAAFESAAQAAAAARAAIELSRSTDGPSSPDNPRSGTSPHNKQEVQKPEDESKPKSENKYANRREGDEEEGSRMKGEVKNSVGCASEGKEKSEMDKASASNLKNGLDMKAKEEKTEESQNASFRLNLERKPISVRTKRVRGY